MSLTLYDLEAADDRGLSIEAFYGPDAATMDRGLENMASSFPAANANRSGTTAYWKGNAPVMAKSEYNGESLMLPLVAPVDADVSAKTVIVQRTFDLIRQHSGGKKVNWYR